MSLPSQRWAGSELASRAVSRLILVILWRVLAWSNYLRAYLLRPNSTRATWFAVAHLRANCYSRAAHGLSLCLCSLSSFSQRRTSSRDMMNRRARASDSRYTTCAGLGGEAPKPCGVKCEETGGGGGAGMLGSGARTAKKRHAREQTSVVCCGALRGWQTERLCEKTWPGWGGRLHDILLW